MTMRKYYFSFISFILLFHIILVSAAVAANKIMPLGDSITYDDRTSDTRTDGERIAYRFRLWQLLNDGGYDFDFVGSQHTGFDFFPDAENEGHPAWTDDEIAASVYDFLDANPAKIVLLHIGTNDLDPDPTGVKNILDEIDRYEADNNIKITVALARIINRSTYSAMTTSFNDNVEAMAFLRVNDSNDPAFPDRIVFGTEVDMEDGAEINYDLITDNPPGDMWDNLHPYDGVDSGYSKMANVWFSALEGILPWADAGPDQNVDEFELVTLNASGSTDPDGSTDPGDSTLTYQWVQTETGGTPPVVLSPDAQAIQPTFEAPDVDLTDVTLTFMLTVTDENGLDSTDTVDVVVAKIQPQAEAGPAQSVYERDRVDLDASGSVPVGLLSYQWIQIQTDETPVVNLLPNDQAIQPYFTAPDVGVNGETLTFELTVTDDDGIDSTDLVNITVRNRNSSGGGGGGGGGGGCFIATATNGSQMTLSGKAPHEPHSQIAMVIWQRLMAGNITLLTPRAGHTATQAIVVSMAMLIISCVAIILRKPRKRWLKL